MKRHTSQSIIVWTWRPNSSFPRFTKDKKTVHPDPVEGWGIQAVHASTSSARTAYMDSLGLGEILEEYVFSIMD
jgi:hypothetical protein